MGKKKSINKIINYNTIKKTIFFFFLFLNKQQQEQKKVLSTVSETNKFPGNSTNLTFKIVNDDSLAHYSLEGNQWKLLDIYWHFVLPKVITFTLVMAGPKYIKNKKKK